ncbi:alkaline phosphatase D family protein, partial [candidate division KSB1 bacterium]
VELQIREGGTGSWETIGEEKIDPMSRTAVFRIENWNSEIDIPYRLLYDLYNKNGVKEYLYEGTVRKEPLAGDEIVVAGFTGNNDLGFPNNEIVRHLKYHDPDLMFFSGDQIYEGVGGFGVQRAPVDKACLDYLRKWYLLGWSFSELMRDRPAVCIPDDHDVYHGNVWGQGGKATDNTGDGAYQQDSGGYKMPPEWVNMVQRTQTANLPDPYDPAPVLQNIGVYYCNMNYGGISFAVIEDRKFKTAPKALVPKGEIWNGWPQSDNFNAAEESDVPGAVLLGERQLGFLKDWASDWSYGTWMKVLLSQTIFANVATLPEDAKSGAVIPGLPILEKAGYAENEKIVNDFDSNGWPQTGRKKALREMRKAFAFHIAGDQHLGSTIQYGVDTWRDAGFAFCVPAVSNIWPRRWYPPYPGGNRESGSPEYTGDYRDGFGNYMTVHAVSNPYRTGKIPVNLYDRATGYGIIRFKKEDRTIMIECWPRWSDPSLPDAEQYPGWPITVSQFDNYGRQPEGFLPLLEITGITDPVVQVINRKDNEIVYTIRIKGSEYRPKVFEQGEYTIRIGEPDTGQIRVFGDIRSTTGETGVIKVEF